MVRSIIKDGKDLWRYCECLESITDERKVTTELVYRSNNYQIERVILPPYVKVPLHRHPNVDSYEFPLWGAGDIVIGHRKFFTKEEIAPWKPCFVSRKTWHAGYGYERESAFLSVQYWTIPITGTISTDWEGV